MSDTDLLSTTLLGLVSCVGSKVGQYVILSLLGLYSGVFLARPFLPSARMHKLEKIVVETADLLQRAIEERVLSNREFVLGMQLRLSRANLDKSSLRSQILRFEWHPTQEYLHILGGVSNDIEKCRREVKKIQDTILDEVERERQLLYSEEIIILSSGFSMSTRHYISGARLRAS